MSRRFVLLGHPVGHSISPAIHQAAYAALGLLDHRYEAVDCPTEDSVRDQVRLVAAGVVAGANVTVPHKRLALALADDVDASAADVGAANVLAPRVVGGDRRVVAYNTDVVALAEEIAARRPNPSVAAVVGSGGAALAAVAACRRIGAGRVVVVARGFREEVPASSWPRASAFEALGAEPLPWSDAAGSAWFEAARATDVVIQATSAGMKGADPGDSVADVVPWSSLRSDVLIYDAVYNPPETPFTRAAAARGLEVVSGLGMLVGQAAHALRIWLGVSPPVAAMRAAAEAALFRGDPR